MGFGGIIKEIAPIALGGLTSYFTGSDILGGLAAGASSKLLGDSWGEAALKGIGTGLGSSLLGVSGGGGLFAGLGGAAMGAGAAGQQVAGNALPAAGGASSGLFGGLSGIGDWITENPGMTTAALGALMAMSQRGGGAEEASTDPVDNPANDPEYAEWVKNSFAGWQPHQQIAANVPDWYVYGQGPQQPFFTGGAPQNAARGGSIRQAEKPSPGAPRSGALAVNGGYSDGPGGGQDDIVPVNLSAGEYVIPADVVADLGDGNSAEGAKKLDAFRAAVRRHKNVKGHPPMAKALEKYL
jgi:hypothetical protein